MDNGLLILVINAIVTPLLVIGTLWVRSRIASDTRTDARQDGLIKNLVERVDTCESRHDKREKEIREIRMELKNRDAEYVSLFQQHTTLKAKYEVLSADHQQLKKEYEETAQQLATLKTDIKDKAELAAKEMAKI